MYDRRFLRRLMRVGRRKMAKLEEHSPGKLLNRHLLSKALEKWQMMHRLAKYQSSWAYLDPPSPDSYSWDDESDFVTLSSLTDARKFSEQYMFYDPPDSPIPETDIQTNASCRDAPPSFSPSSFAEVNSC
ncbi:unnamed protein product [Protopolystoma xenopodis]|uniref:Uncharacterized protein n=1 Tax=Protopolystoma xenopodis TaxID=117903 RepID=A0A3S5FDM9_9PLAT|nr:unnamed protein product [Protopolystoma xenopodis]